MSDENKEKKIPETPEDGKEKVDGDWKWDASVPETQTDEIILDDLAPIKDKEEPAVEKKEKPEEKAEEKSEEKKEEKKSSKKEDKKDDKKEKSEKKKEKNKNEKETKKKNDQKNDDCCIMCGKSRKGSDSDLYCIDCAKKVLRTHFGIPQILLAFIMIFFAAFGYVMCVSNVQVSTYLVEAENLLEEKRYEDASEKVVEYSEKVGELDAGLNTFLAMFDSDPNRKDVDFFVDGRLSTRIQLRAFINSFQFDDSHITAYLTAVNTEFPDGLPKTAEYKDLREMYDFCLGTRTYMNSIRDDWYGLMYTETVDGTAVEKIDYDKAIAFLNSCPNDTLAQKASNGFFRLVAETYNESDAATQYKILDGIYKDLGSYGYIFDFVYVQVAWSHDDYAKCVEIADKMYERNRNDITGYYYAIRSNILQGDLQAADARCEKLIADNPENIDYYSIKAEILRRMGKFSESVEVCKKGIAVTADAQIYNQQAISYMLLNDNKSALEASKNAYELALQTVQNNEIALEILNTTALIAFLCGDTELYDDLVYIFEESGIELEENVSQCIKGEITFEQIYMEGMGDV